MESQLRLSLLGRLSFALVLLLSGCGGRRPAALVPGGLPVPDATAGWVDLQPGMTLKLERAYFKSATAPRRLENYVGLETAQYRVGARGNLERVGVTELAGRPGDQARVATVLRSEQARLRAQRLYFQVALDKAAGISSAVLLSAAARLRILRVGDVGTLCRGAKAEVLCQVFPEGNSVSLGFDVTVNGVEKNLLWGTNLGSVVGAAKSFSLQRYVQGKLTEVKLAGSGAEAGKVPLMPRDVIRF